MSTKDKREKEFPKYDHLIKEAAGKNKDALEYLKLLSTAARLSDDLYDNDYPVTGKEKLHLIETLFLTIPSNKFFRDNYVFLLSQHMVMWNTWELSNTLDHNDPDEIDRIYSHVIRDYFYNIVPLVALLTQGKKEMKRLNYLTYYTYRKKLGE